MPTAVTPQDFTEPLAHLRALVNQISTERVQMRNDSEKLQDMILMEIRSLEKKLGELVAYINQGGNEKKGEGGSSSRETQPPPVIVEADLVLAVETVGVVLQVEDSIEVVDTESQEELDTG
ncbi:hypothetical protein F511_06974 [Dorcoceras hygrometricum]|uniref:Uncharacterized protein n=1 Tax=Dorcoceras hygrometricum TaxID=472368 RepID=A0A2Z7BFH8_9LAMI|nr:hypothetical protein F511_06974 [Dorcoceras hygrometricum]